MTKPNRGFTLVELLIAIAIIAILAVTLFPNVVNIKRNSADTASELFARNMTQWASSWLLEDNSRQVTNLAVSCTDASYISQGAPTSLPGAITACEILIAPTGPGTFGARVTSVSGQIFEYTL